MAKTNVKLSFRPMRIFSDKLEKKIVIDVEQGKVNVTGAAKEYAVSTKSVYCWLKNFQRIYNHQQQL